MLNNSIRKDEICSLRWGELPGPDFLPNPLKLLQTSMALATGIILRALHSRANFYSACVYLSQSNACLMVSPFEVP